MTPSSHAALQRRHEALLKEAEAAEALREKKRWEAAVIAQQLRHGGRVAVKKEEAEDMELAQHGKDEDMELDGDGGDWVVIFKILLEKYYREYEENVRGIH